MAGYVSVSNSLPMLRCCKRRAALADPQPADGEMLVGLLPAACAPLSAHFPVSRKLGPRPEVCLPYFQILSLGGS